MVEHTFNVHRHVGCLDIIDCMKFFCKQKKCLNFLYHGKYYFMVMFYWCRVFTVFMIKIHIQSLNKVHLCVIFKLFTDVTAEWCFWIYCNWLFPAAAGSTALSHSLKYSQCLFPFKTNKLLNQLKKNKKWERK